MTSPIKQAIIIIISLLISAAIIIPAISFMNQIQQDHANLTSVVSFLNQQVATANATHPTTK